MQRPVINTSATKSSDCGEYEINVGGADALNYEFNYVSGLLIITKIDQRIQWEQTFENIHIGDQIELLAIADSGLPIQYIIRGNVEEYVSGNKTFIDCLGMGDVTIRATQEGNVNYNPAVRVVKSFIISDDDSVDNIYEDNHGLNIYTKDGYLINDSPSVDKLAVYDIYGHNKYMGKDRQIYLGTGIFIVYVNGRSYKIICN